MWANTDQEKVWCEENRLEGMHTTRENVKENKPDKNRTPAKDGKFYNKQVRFYSLLFFLYCCYSNLFLFLKSIVLNLGDKLDKEQMVVSTSLMKSTMESLVGAMNGKYDARSQSMCYINKGFEITATWKDEALHPVDHYFLDEDVVKLEYSS